MRVISAVHLAGEFHCGKEGGIETKRETKKDVTHPGALADKVVVETPAGLEKVVELNGQAEKVAEEKATAGEGRMVQEAALAPQTTMKKVKGVGHPLVVLTEARLWA